MRAKNQKKQNPPRLLRINIKMTSGSCHFEVLRIFKDLIAGTEA